MAKRREAPKVKKVKPPKKMMVVDFDEKGNPLCPGCKRKDLTIDDYGLSPEGKREHGTYYFKKRCPDCNIIIDVYKEI